jgi:hypothetical protein
MEPAPEEENVTQYESIVCFGPALCDQAVTGSIIHRDWLNEPSGKSAQRVAAGCLEPPTPAGRDCLSHSTDSPESQISLYVAQSTESQGIVAGLRRCRSSPHLRSRERERLGVRFAVRLPSLQFASILDYRTSRRPLPGRKEAISR